MVAPSARAIRRSRNHTQGRGVLQNDCEGAKTRVHTLSACDDILLTRPAGNLLSSSAQADLQDRPPKWHSSMPARLFELSFGQMNSRAGSILRDRSEKSHPIASTYFAACICVF